LTETYNEAANESTGDDFRSDIIAILQEEHKLQSALFHHMNRKGYYKVQPASQQDIKAALERNQKS
jgi:spore coat protein CotF